MDSNQQQQQQQQFLGNPSRYPIPVENFFICYQLAPSNLPNAHVIYNTRNGVPKTQLEEQVRRSNFMVAANKPPPYTPRGKRKILKENDCVCSEYENAPKMAKIQKMYDKPINLTLNSTQRQGNMMMSTPKSSTLRRSNPIQDSEYQDFVAAFKSPPSRDPVNGEYREFPKQFDNKVILGPNATEVDLAAYRTINFVSPKIATRQLLVLVFPSYILATHSLTGKPPTRFDNTFKTQLDASKVEDIIHCVLSETNCNRQDIRAAITAKCCEIARLFKTRSMRNTI